MSQVIESHRPVILNLSSAKGGGAGMSTMDFQSQLVKLGYESYLAIRGKTCICPNGEEISIPNRKPHLWNRLRRRIYRYIVKNSKVAEQYSFYNPCERFTCYSASDLCSILPQKPDIIFVHWVSDFANAKYLRDIQKITNAKICLLMIDHAMYSGGCHYHVLCKQFLSGCKNCPAVSSSIVKLGTALNFSFKLKYLPQDLYVKSPSSEDHKKLLESPLYKNAKIIDGISPLDDRLFCPSISKNKLREKWGLPLDKVIAFFGSTNLDEERKGMKVLYDSIDLASSDRVVFVSAGSVQAKHAKPEITHLGLLKLDELIELYQLADFFICPSLADAGPLMVRQAIMCGTPVVAFPVGMSSDLVIHKKTGYLAKYGSAQDMAQGIKFISSLSQAEARQMSENCRNLAHDKYSFSSPNSSIDDFIASILR